MPDPRHDGDLGIDYTEIELRVLAFMTDNGPQRKRAADRREGIVNAMMTPTGSPEHDRHSPAP
jgi:hypothetical protein